MFNTIADDIKNAFGKQNNMLTQIIIINSVLFVICNLLDHLAPPAYSFILNWFAVQSSGITALLRIWTLFTYMFLHRDLFHILFNMLWLFWMGKLFTEYINQKHLSLIYVPGGIMGAILFLLISKLFPSFFNENSYLIGASGGVMAVVVATATYLPNYPIRLLFFGEIKLKYIALGILLISTILNITDNAGGKIAHLGGALWGYFYMLNFRKSKNKAFFLDKVLKKLVSVTEMKKKSPLRVEHKKPMSDEHYNTMKLNKQRVIDEILDKISKSGYDSLSKQEKELLFKMSKDDK
jgi:membrane associated rhomboid family serine protease